MNHQDRTAIDGLFERLGEAERRTGPRDADAESLILEHTRAQPAAPYYMAQAILVQEQALTRINERVQALEQELAERPMATGGFLSSLFGAADTPGPGPAQPPGEARQRSAGARGGFMGGAVQTAVAVAGGVVLASVLSSMFASNEAQASEATPDSADSGAGPADAFGHDDAGDGFDDFGDF